MLLCSLALAGAQREMRLLSRSPARIEQQLWGTPLLDLSFTEAGIAVACAVDAQGFSSFGGADGSFPGYLVPEDGGGRPSAPARFHRRKSRVKVGE